MAQRAGSADLPLHSGHVPKWLADRMTRLGTVIARRLSTITGARVVAPPCPSVLVPVVRRRDGDGLAFLGHHDQRRRCVETRPRAARRRTRHPCVRWPRPHSRRTPGLRIGNRVGFDGAALATASRLVAKVDSAAVQDGFELYLHGFIVTDDGHWVIVQQGMNRERKQARRYHWLSEGLASFVDAPHAAIAGEEQGEIINLADRGAEASRRGQIEYWARSGRPDRGEVRNWRRETKHRTPRQHSIVPHLVMPSHHDVRPGDVSLGRLHGTLAAAADAAPRISPNCCLPGVGARTVQSLAMVAEVVHGAPYRFADPARFSLAHGGKDRHPFPVPIEVYDQTIRVLKSAVQSPKLGREEELAALKRLDDQARRLERQATGPGVAELIAREREDSHAYGGRSVFGWELAPKDCADANDAMAAQTPPRSSK